MAEEGLTFSGWRRGPPWPAADGGGARNPTPAPTPKVIPKTVFVPVVPATAVPSAAHSDDEDDTDKGIGVLPRAAGCTVGGRRCTAILAIAAVLLLFLLASSPSDELGGSVPLSFSTASGGTAEYPPPYVLSKGPPPPNPHPPPPPAPPHPATITAVKPTLAAPAAAVHAARCQVLRRHGLLQRPPLQALDRDPVHLHRDHDRADGRAVHHRAAVAAPAAERSTRAPATAAPTRPAHTTANGADARAAARPVDAAAALVAAAVPVYVGVQDLLQHTRVHGAAVGRLVVPRRELVVGEGPHRRAAAHRGVPRAPAAAAAALTAPARATAAHPAQALAAAVAAAALAAARAALAAAAAAAARRPGARVGPRGGQGPRQPGGHRRRPALSEARAAEHRLLGVLPQHVLCVRKLRAVRHRVRIVWAVCRSHPPHQDDGA